MEYYAVFKKYHYPSVHWQMNGSKIWCIHTMEYDSVFKRQEILMRATTQMNLEDIMPDEMSLSQNGKYCII